MASTYHPFYETLWDDDKLEGASFETKAFFAYLFTNPRVRPSGIYRVSDAQLAVDTTLPLTRVRRYLADLSARRLIVRDGTWIFVRAYFKRQPKHNNLVKNVANALEVCSSQTVLTAFSEQYPFFGQPSSNHRRTVGQRLGDRYQSQSIAEQSNTEQCNERLPDNRSTLPLEHQNLQDHPDDDPEGAALELLVFLNRKADKQYKPSAVNLGLIAARLREGATVNQCRAVIARKVARWKGDPKMNEFLRPATLFAETNFAQYLGELPATAFAPAEGPP
jgi:uncharacterized phage protein (TIGR02220 family)